MKKHTVSECETPTHKRIVGPLDDWFQADSARWPAGRDAIATEMNLKATEDLLALCLQILPDEDSREVTTEAFKLALEIARELVQYDEKTRTRVEIMLSCMARGAAYLVQEMALLKTEAEQRNNILVNNAGKAAAKQYALSRARHHIKDDEGQNLRMGVLADQVYRDLVGTEHEAYLPGTPDGVRKWLGDGDLPEYVRSRGRPKTKR